MRTSKCLFILIALSGAACLGADLTGNWLVKQVADDGNVRETYYDLKQGGSSITGVMRSGSFDREIESGTLDDAGNVTLTMRAGPGGPGGFPGGPGPGAGPGGPPGGGPGGPRGPMVVTGKLVGDELHIMMRGRPNTPPVEVTATRAPAGAGAPPAKIPPPALHKVAYNGLAKTPPMGWNSWNKFAGRVTAEDVKGMADAIVSSGMQKAGYIYINIDDTWQGTRDASGNITANKKFPDMKGLADFVHGKGLKLGIYSSPGTKTCAGYEGSYGHEAQDAKTYAAWGMDYLKYDWCSASRMFKDEEMQAVYQRMGDALQATGRPIVYSLCQYGRADVQKWGPEVGGNLWRTTGDIRDQWASMEIIGFGQAALAPFAGPGHWNDPDMLEIGNGGMSDTEYRTHMTLWSMLASPLLAGNDIRVATPAILEILTNPEVIAIDQDKLGKQATRLSQNGKQEIWTRELAGGAKAVALFNRDTEPAKINVKWSEIGLPGSAGARDLWAKKDVAAAASYTAEVPGHGVILLKVTK